MNIEHYSLDSEQALLGALLQEPYRIDDLPCSVTDLWQSSHKMILTAMFDLSEKGIQIDLFTLAQALEAKKELTEVGGLMYLGSLKQNSAGGANIKVYANTIRDMALKRELVATSSAIIERCNDGLLSGADLVAEAEAEIFAVNDKRESHEPVEIKTAVHEALEHLGNVIDGVQYLSSGLEKLDEITGGLHGGAVYVIAARPSMGKAQPLDSKILMANGDWKLMGDLSIGDPLASVDGNKSFVTGIFPQGVKTVMKITFSDGRQMECCNEHLWNVHRSDWKHPKVITTEEVAALLNRPAKNKRAMWVQQLNGEYGNSEILPVDPWLLGALLGDGDLTQRTIRFSKDAKETISRIKKSLPEEVCLVGAGGCDYRLSVKNNIRGDFDSNPLTAGIRSLGLMGLSSEKKFIPKQYLKADRESRLNLARGLFDTDGWVEKHGSVLYSTCSQQLAKDLQSLVRGLGYWCSIREKKTAFSYKGKKKVGSMAYVLTVSGNNKQELFLFGGKKERCFGGKVFRRVNFKKIEVSREAACQCISVSHDSSLYVTDDYVVTHNTALACSIAHGIAKQDKSVYFATLEMPRREIASRLIAIDANVNIGKVKEWDEADYERLTVGAHRVEQLKITIDHEEGLGIAKLRSRARRTKRKKGLDCIVVDYLQLMKHKADNREREVAALSGGIKSLAKELDVPVILLAQLNRECDARADKRPLLSDLRESGSIEQDADVVIMLYRDEVYNKDTMYKGAAELLIRKNRHGATGDIYTSFNHTSMKFSDMAKEWEKPIEPARMSSRRGFD